MKSLVVYYSKTGNTKKVALDIAKKLKADIDEIKDKDKIGIFGMINCCRKAMKERVSDIIFSKDPSTYDIVILGGPVWAWNLIPQLRNYLLQNKKKIKRLAFFLTFGGSLGKNFEQVYKIKKPIAAISFIDKKVKNGEYKTELDTFIEKLK